MNWNRLLALGLEAGTKAPEFELLDQDMKLHKLTDHLGSKVLIFFYPQDLSPGCTAQACSFRDHNESYKARGIKVFGINTNSIQSHKKFAEKHKINYPLLADQDKAVARKYEVLLPIGIANRISFLINAHGFIEDKFSWLPWKNYAKSLETRFTPSKK
ncbi:peroxiredoxin [bacterium]|nr:peroxiredoxin [bacterium]